MIAAVALAVLLLLAGFWTGMAVERHLAAREAGRRDALPPGADPTPVALLADGFRDYARIVDGGVSAEVEAALQKLVAGDARGGPGSPPSARPSLLQGASRRAYNAEVRASSSPCEEFRVDARWHAKGFVFPPALRRSLLRDSVDEATRDAYRAMFDEQDARLGEPDARLGAPLASAGERKDAES